MSMSSYFNVRIKRKEGREREALSASMNITKVGNAPTIRSNAFPGRELVKIILN
jgi:hypothetical protein